MLVVVVLPGVVSFGGINRAGISSGSTSSGIGSGISRRSNSCQIIALFTNILLLLLLLLLLLFIQKVSPEVIDNNSNYKQSLQISGCGCL